MPEEEGGNFLTRKFMGIPAWVFLIGAAVVGYWYFSRNSSGSSSTSGQQNQAGQESPTGGSGTITTGSTTIDTGAVQVSVSAPNGSPGTSGSQGSSSGGSGSTTSQQVSQLTETDKNASAAVISWRPPQFPSQTGAATTYDFGISPAPKGGVSTMHNIGSRTSYNVGGLQKGTQYTVTVTPSGGSPATKTFTFQG